MYIDLFVTFKVTSNVNNNNNRYYISATMKIFRCASVCDEYFVTFSKIH